MQKPGKFQPIAIAALVIVIISVTPILNFLNFIFCAGVIAGAITGVYYYNKKLTGTSYNLTYTDGAVIGAVSGLTSAVIFVLFFTACVFLLKIFNVNIGNIIREIFEGFGIRSGRSRFSEKIINEYSKNGFSFVHFITVFLLYGILYPLFGTAGGIIGSAVFISKNKKVK